MNLLENIHKGQALHRLNIFMSTKIVIHFRSKNVDIHVCLTICAVIEVRGFIISKVDVIFYLMHLIRIFESGNIDCIFTNGNRNSPTYSVI